MRDWAAGRRWGAGAAVCGLRKRGGQGGGGVGERFFYHTGTETRRTHREEIAAGAHGRNKKPARMPGRRIGRGGRRLICSIYLSHSYGACKSMGSDAGRPPERSTRACIIASMGENMLLTRDCKPHGAILGMVTSKATPPSPCQKHSTGSFLGRRHRRF